MDTSIIHLFILVTLCFVVTCSTEFTTQLTPTNSTTETDGSSSVSPMKARPVHPASGPVNSHQFRYEGGSDDVTLRGCGIGSRYLQNIADRIVGGSPVSITEFPWQVSLRLARGARVSHYCGGTLLNTKFVVTAAHCANDFKSDQIQVHLGSTNLHEKTRGTKVASVKKITIHPSYNSNQLHDDIALIELNESIHEAGNLEFMFIRGICLPKVNEEFEGNSTVTGWGRTSEGGGTSETLQAAEVPLMSDQTCRKFYGRKIADTMVCAGYENGGFDSCQGDSGGPLTKAFENRYVLVGVVSWGYGCARPGNPGVYTQVSKYVPWIRSVVAPAPKPSTPQSPLSALLPFLGQTGGSQKASPQNDEREDCCDECQ